MAFTAYLSPFRVVRAFRWRLASLRNRRSQLRSTDTPLIARIKDNFEHGPRELRHGLRRYSTDCLYCHAVPGTFETTLELLAGLLAKRSGCRLLNLGGGAGQVSTIFSDLGFDVVNVDLHPGTCGEKNLQFDLNIPGPLPLRSHKFDVVVCQEVIEHVENPWDLFRKAASALRVGGYLIVTTPNVASLWSRLLFLRSGYLHWFTQDCHSYHINPLHRWEIEMIASRVGFRLISLSGNGDYYFARRRRAPTDKSLINNEALIFLFQQDGGAA